MTRVLDLLFETSPYLDLDVSTVELDTQGWGSDHPVFEKVITIVRPKLIIEVGSWKGRSALAMADIVKRDRVDAEIVCVDTWLGSPEHWLKVQQEWYTSLQILNGFPRLYQTFLANVVSQRQCDVITPFPSTSENAALILDRLNIRADVCYIDAAHEYASVMRDLEAYWMLLAGDGVLIGDDYGHWPGVTQAAQDFAGQKGLILQAGDGKFVLGKGRWSSTRFLDQIVRLKASRSILRKLAKAIDPASSTVFGQPGSS